MSEIKSKFENAKDKVAGEMKTVTGKVTGNQQLELKGRLQSSKADLRKKVNIKHMVNEAKEDIAEKVNDVMEKNDKK